MRRTVRLIACLFTCAALLAFPARAQAARVDVAAAWGAPTRLYAPELRYGDFVGYVHARRLGAGTGSASIDLHLSRSIRLADGGQQVDSIIGIRQNAMNSAYRFDAVRWKGTLAVSLPVERRSVVERADGTFVRSGKVSGIMRVELRWTGTGDAVVDPSVETTYATRPVIVGVRATKQATVNGALRFGSDVGTITGAAGVMEHVAEA